MNDGAETGGGGGTPPADPPVPKTYTEADLKKAAAAAVAETKKQLSTVQKQLQETMESKTATDAEKAAADAAYTALLSKEEQAEKVRQQNEAKYKGELEAERKTRAEAEAKYQEAVITRSLLDAALPKASGKDPTGSAELIKTLLRQNAKLAGDKVVVELETTVEGVTAKKEMTPAEAVAHLEAQVEKYGPLFKSYAVAGLGGNNDPKRQADGSYNLKDMPMDEYMKRRKEILGK